MQTKSPNPGYLLPRSAFLRGQRPPEKLWRPLLCLPAKVPAGVDPRAGAAPDLPAGAARRASGRRRGIHGAPAGGGGAAEGLARQGVAEWLVQ